MKHIVQVLIIFLFSINITGQDTFRVHYNNPFYLFGGAGGHSVHVGEDTIYVVLATIIDTDLIGTGYILKYDFQGNVLDSVELDSQNPILSVNLGVYGGNIFEGDGFVLPFSEFNNSLEFLEGDSLLKINLSGAEVWKKDISIDSTLRHLYRKVIRFNDGYAVIGDVYNPDETGIFNRKNIVTVTDSEGNVLWHRIYEDTNNVMFAYQTTDGGLLLGSSKRYTSGLNTRDTKIIKTDSLGNVMWHHIFGGLGSEGRGPVFEAKDGSYVVFSIDSDLPGYGPFSGPLWVKRIVDAPLTSDGYEVIDDIHWDTSNEERMIYNALELPDSSFAVIGMGAQDLATHRHAYIGKLDANLDSLWSHYYTFITSTDSLYPNPVSQILHDIKLMPDNGFIATGYMHRTANDPELPSVSQMVLLRVDEYGCLEPGCQFVGIEEIVIGLEETMLLYPNPVISGGSISIGFKERLGIEMPYAHKSTELIVYDQYGKVVHRQQLGATGSNASFEVMITIPDVSAGQYIIQWVGEAWYDSVVLVVER